MTVWKIKNAKISDEAKLSGKYNPVVLSLLRNRSISSQEEIDSFFRSNYEDLQDPSVITHMKKAIGRIVEAKDKKEKIAIFGDYDADGVTATAIVYETLLALGHDNLCYYIPDRQVEGYGMNEKAVEYLEGEGVKLIITVDCGISNAEEIEKAAKAGIDVIITDHHHIPPRVPAAYAIINPNMDDSGFSFRQLAGVGVAFQLARALCQKIDPGNVEQLKWMLDLVAIGTVADCVPLLGDNRILAKYGFVVLSKTRRAGLKEMFSVGRMEISENRIPSTHQVAFQIAPRINAAGRMDHANAAYNLVIEQDRVRARDLALELEARNQERQKITSEISREVEILSDNAFREKKFICAENIHWPIGVLGLVAGKIMEKYRKPTAIFQLQEGDYVGSLRSIPELNIMEALEHCSRLIEKFGGHAQAAGARIKKENYGKFYEHMSRFIEERLANVETVSTIDIDCEITDREIGWELVEDLKKMEPFGAGNPEPIFLSKNMEITDARIVGNGSKHWKLSLKGCSGSPKIFDAIGFSMVERFPDLVTGDKLDVVFSLAEDEWNGNKKLQLKIIDMKVT